MPPLCRRYSRPRLAPDRKLPLWPAPMPPDFFELEGGQLGLVVRDATVKGMPAALVMATTCRMLRAVAQSSNSPGEVLRRVNEALSVRIPPNMFVTCFYALLDPESGSLSYANAGHDLPY